jgi:hypothetical protein
MKIGLLKTPTEMVTRRQLMNYPLIKYYIISLLLFFILGCVGHNVQERNEDSIPGAQTEDGRGIISNLNGRWYLSASDVDFRLDCNMHFKGTIFFGYCSTEGRRDDNFALSIFPYESYVSFNLVDLRINRMVGEGDLYQENDYFSGMCIFCRRNGESKKGNCLLTRH